ncbi:MAG: hypothetical protein IPO92_23515 [Saprospiraceae bacterium]|nr:hypothetical protein [Saprospiraceae bacterium]
MSITFGQKDFAGLFPCYSLVFGAYLLIIFKSKISLKYQILLGILVRISLIPVFPNLSDDIYRFFWDGSLTVNGINPYGILPSEIVGQNIPGLTNEIFLKLNSKEYFTIYPPLSQLYYSISALTGNLLYTAVAMKSLFLFTEIIGLWYMVKLLTLLKIEQRWSMLYFINPLVILEGAGNLHFEVVMIAILNISIYYIFTKKIIHGALFMAAGIGIKLLPLMILPYFWYRLKGKEWVIFFSVLGTSLIIIFIPVAGGVQISSFLNSVDLYFRKFEFNASLYYMLRYIGAQISGYNLIKYIGPLLALITILFNIYKSKEKHTFYLHDFLQYSLTVWTIYLVFATTIHPWYITTLIFFTVFDNRKYAIAWSYLIFMTYINYSYKGYYENLWIVFVEYLVLIIFITFDIKTCKRLTLKDNFVKFTLLKQI